MSAKRDKFLKFSSDDPDSSGDCGNVDGEWRKPPTIVDIGDFVARTVLSGPHIGRQGYVVNITRHGDGLAVPDSVTVRLLGQPEVEIVVAPDDLRKP